MTCCDTIEVETIQHIYDSQTVEIEGEDVPRDVVDEAMGMMVSVDFGVFASVVHDRIWSDFRLRMIGSCDTDTWVQLLADKLDSIGMVYYTRMQAITAVEDLTDIGGVITRVYGTRTDTGKGINEEMPDTKSLQTDITYPSTKAHSENVKGEQTDTEHDSGSAAEHLSKFYDALRDPLDDMMRDLSVLWMNMW